MDEATAVGLEKTSPPSPGQIISYLLAACGQDEIPRDQRDLHTIVHDIQRSSDEFAELLAPFIFSQKVDIYPFSRVLADCLTAALVGLLRIYPFNGQMYWVDPTVRADVLAKAPGEFGAFLPRYQALAVALGEACQAALPEEDEATDDR